MIQTFLKNTSKQKHNQVVSQITARLQKNL